MENKQLFGDQPKEKRVESLKEIADRVSKEPVTRKYSESELAQMREELGNVSIIQDEKKTLLAEEVKSAKEEIKLMEKKRKSLMGNIRSKSQTTTEEVYGIANHDDKVMEFYDAEGVFIYNRRLTPEERQTHIKTMKVAK